MESILNTFAMFVGMKAWVNTYVAWDPISPSGVAKLAAPQICFKKKVY
jgi:hypothetical protein